MNRMMGIVDKNLTGMLALLQVKLELQGQKLEPYKDTMSAHYASTMELLGLVTSAWGKLMSGKTGEGDLSAGEYRTYCQALETKALQCLRPRPEDVYKTSSEALLVRSVTEERLAEALVTKLLIPVPHIPQRKRVSVSRARNPLVDAKLKKLDAQYLQTLGTISKMSVLVGVELTWMSQTGHSAPQNLREKGEQIASVLLGLYESLVVHGRLNYGEQETLRYLFEETPSFLHTCRELAALRKLNAGERLLQSLDGKL
jgi:hypothetical protein